MGISEHTTAVIAVALLVILSVTVLIPVVGSSTVTTETQSNGGSHMLFSTGAADLEYSSGVYTADGETITAPSSERPFALGRSFELTANGIKYYHDNTVDRIPAGSSDIDWSFVLNEDGTFVFTAGSDTLTGYSSPQHTYHRVASNGEYVQALPSNPTTKFNSDAYVVLYNSGGYNTVNWVFGEGKINQKMLASYATATNSGGNIRLNINYVPDSTDEGVYNFVNGQVDGDSQNVISMLAPADYRVVAEASGTVYTILSILPILVIIGIVLIAAAAFISRE